MTLSCSLHSLENKKILKSGIPSAGSDGFFEHFSNTEVSEKHSYAFMNLLIAIYIIYVEDNTPEILNCPRERSTGLC